MKNSSKLKGLLTVAATAALFTFSGTAKADYPEKSVEMTVLLGELQIPLLRFCLTYCRKNWASRLFRLHERAAAVL